MSKSATTTSTRVQAAISRIAALTGTVGGLEGSLMLAQYSSPIVIALLLALAKLRDRLAQSVKGGGVGGEGLRGVAAGWAVAAGSIGDARTIMRLVGLFPIIVPTLRLIAPDPIKALILNPIPTLQLLSLLAYYPLEHAAWLASKGVIKMDPKRIGSVVTWSVRAWGIYVVAEYFKLRGTYANLVYRTKQMRRQASAAVSAKEAEGYELQAAGESAAGEKASAAVGADGELVKRKAALQADWAGFKDAALINAAYTPLLINWSLPSGLWTNPLITAAFGTVVAGTKLRRAWRAAGSA